MAIIIYGFGPPLPQGKETVRLTLMRKLADRLAEMSLANGYSRDYSAVTYGQSEDYGFTEGDPRVFLWDQDETSEALGGKDVKSLEVNVEVLGLLPDDVDAGLTAQHNNEILADVTRAMLTDPLTRQVDEYFLAPNGYAMADGLVYFRSEGVFGMGETKRCGSISTWVLSYKTVRGKPHLLREEE